MKDSKAAFYFANLGADVTRCARAAETGKQQEYELSLERAQKTLRAIEQEHRPEAYEEGLLLLLAFEYARESRALPAFRRQVNTVIEPFAARLGFV